jgi:hypothetical protein
MFVLFVLLKEYLVDQGCHLNIHMVEQAKEERKKRGRKMRWSLCGGWWWVTTD